MSRNRGDDGKYTEKTTIDDVIAVLIERDEPLTGKEVGKELGISNRSALDKLNSLKEKGNVERKKVGAVLSFGGFPTSNAPVAAP
ncbi:hypothetical protein [Halalkalicoccus salilacus]|uniref:hypothetical protein n=1 Tax=Halalkalicoccus sp. GCM10025704 TaxID=3252662 RepID=UPI00360AE1DF